MPPGPPELRTLTRRTLAVLAALVALSAVLAPLVGWSAGGTDGLLVAALLELLVLQVVAVLGLALLWRRMSAHYAASRANALLLARTEQRVIRQGRRLGASNRVQGRIQRHTERLLHGERKHAETTALIDRRHLQGMRHAEKVALGTERQVAAILDLERLVPLPSHPALGGWAASADFLLLIVQTLVRERPSVVLECGSGTSTLYLAKAAKTHGIDCRIVALDHDASYAAATRALLRAHDVADVAEVRHAALAPSGLPDHEPLWYDTAALGDVSDVGLLVVDGPPGAGGPQARWPAVPLVKERATTNLVVVLDDVEREDERMVAERWARENPDMDLRIDTDLQKHAAVLRRR